MLVKSLRLQHGHQALYKSRVVRGRQAARSNHLHWQLVQPVLCSPQYHNNTDPSLLLPPWVASPPYGLCLYTRAHPTVDRPGVAANKTCQLLPFCSWRPGAASLLWLQCALASLSADLVSRYGAGAAILYRPGPYTQALSEVGVRGSKEQDGCWGLKSLRDQHFGTPATYRLAARLENGLAVHVCKHLGLHVTQCRCREPLH